MKTTIQTSRGPVRFHSVGSPIIGIPNTPNGSLHLYKTGEYLRPASAAELAQSLEAAKTDGGRGVYSVHGWSVYVQQ